MLGLYYDHEKFKMFKTRIVNYRVHRFVFMSTLNSHWLDEKEEGKVITCNLLSIAVTEGFPALKRSNLTNDNSDACRKETSFQFLCRTGI